MRLYEVRPRSGIRRWPPAGRIVAVAAALGVTLAGCGRGGSGPQSVGAPAGPAWSAIPATARLYYDNSGGVRDSLRLVVRDAAALQDVWSRATSGQSAPPAVPAVDFGRDMLLVVGAGRKTAEEQIRVDSVSIQRPPGGGQETMFAIVRLTEGCQRFNIEAYPLEIVRVNRFDGPVEFVERRTRPDDCGAAN